MLKRIHRFIALFLSAALIVDPGLAAVPSAFQAYPTHLVTGNMHFEKEALVQAPLWMLHTLERAHRSPVVRTMASAILVGAAIGKSVPPAQFQPQALFDTTHLVLYGIAIPALIWLFKEIGGLQSVFPMMASYDGPEEPIVPGGSASSVPLRQQVGDFLQLGKRPPPIQLFARESEIETLRQFYTDSEQIPSDTASGLLQLIENRRNQWDQGHYSLENAPTLLLAFVHVTLNPDNSNREAPLTADQLAPFYHQVWNLRRDEINESALSRFYGIRWRERWFFGWFATGDIATKAVALSYLRRDIRRVVRHAMEKNPQAFAEAPSVPVPAADWDATVDLYAITDPALRLGLPRPEGTEDLIDRLKQVSKKVERLRTFATPRELREIDSLMGQKKGLRARLEDPSTFVHFADLIIRIESRAARWTQGDYRIDNAPAAVKAFISRWAYQIPYRDIDRLRETPDADAVQRFVMAVAQAHDEGRLGSNEGIEDQMLYFFNSLDIRQSDLFLTASKGRADRISDYVELIRLRKNVYRLVRYAHSSQGIEPPEARTVQPLAGSPSRASQAGGLRLVDEIDRRFVSGRNTTALQYLITRYHLNPAEDRPPLTSDRLIELYDELNELSIASIWPGQSIASYAAQHPTAEAIERFLKLLIHRSPYRRSYFGDTEAAGVRSSEHDLAPADVSGRLTTELDRFFNHPEGAVRFSTYSEWGYLRSVWSRYANSRERFPEHVHQVAQDLLARVRAREQAWTSNHISWETLPTAAAAFVHFVLNFNRTRYAFPNAAYHGQSVSPDAAQRFVYTALDPRTGNVKSHWQAAFTRAIQANPSNEWVRECCSLGDTSWVADVERVIRSEHEMEQLQQELTVLEEAERRTSSFHGIADEALDVLAGVTYGDPDARSTVINRLVEDLNFSASVAHQLVEAAGALHRPLNDVEQLAQIVEPALAPRITAIVLALGMTAANRHVIERDYPQRDQLTLEQWETLNYLIEHGYRNGAELLAHIPDLFQRKPVAEIAPAVAMASQVNLAAGQETMGLAEVLKRDPEILRLILGDSPAGSLSLEDVLREYAGLTAPVPPTTTSPMLAPTILTDENLEPLLERLTMAQRQVELAGADLEKGSAARAQSAYNRANLILTRLLNEVEPLLEQALNGTAELDERWFDLHLNASNLRETARSMEEHAATAQPTARTEAGQAREAITQRPTGPLDDLEPAVRALIRTAPDGLYVNGYKIYLVTEKKHVEVRELRRLQNAFLKKLVFFSQDINSPAFLQRDPGNRPDINLRWIRRVPGINPGNYRFYARVYSGEHPAIVILTFDTTGDVKGEGSELPSDLLEHLSQANSSSTIDQLRSQYTMTEFVPFKKAGSKGAAGNGSESPFSLSRHIAIRIGLAAILAGTGLPWLMSFWQGSGMPLGAAALLAFTGVTFAALTWPAVEIDIFLGKRLQQDYRELRAPPSIQAESDGLLLDQVHFRDSESFGWVDRESLDEVRRWSALHHVQVKLVHSDRLPSRWLASTNTAERVVYLPWWIISQSAPSPVSDSRRKRFLLRLLAHEGSRIANQSSWRRYLGKRGLQRRLKTDLEIRRSNRLVRQAV